MKYSFSQMIVFVFLLVAITGVSRGSEEAPWPNVLFISIDDMRPRLGAYGHDVVITPNLEQLASKGRLFSRH
jgi:hypothetical protein